MQTQITDGDVRFLIRFQQFNTLLFLIERDLIQVSLPCLRRLMLSGEIEAQRLCECLFLRHRKVSNTLAKILPPELCDLVAFFAGWSRKQATQAIRLTLKFL